MKYDIRWIALGGVIVALIAAALISGLPNAITSSEDHFARWTERLVGTWDWGADLHTSQLFNFQDNMSFSYHEQGEGLIVVSGTWEVLEASANEAHLKLVSHNELRPELDFYFTLLDEDHLQMRTSTETTIGLSFTRHGAEPLDTHVDDGNE